MKEQSSATAHPLWTRDFTIITVGSVISLLGSVLSGFAMSLLVLDYTKSTLLFAVYNVLYMLPHAVMPALCGPFLDRFSRRKTIYILDFISAGLFVVLALIFAGGFFNFTLLAIGNVAVGVIGSIYRVAYDSFYPLLITEGNYSKAYSVASTLETLTMVMTPISAFVYNRMGIVPLFLVNAGCYFVAAVMETRITAREDYIDKQRQNRTETRMGRQMLADFREGMGYLWSEKGLLAVAAYFCVSSFANGAGNTLGLPYFKGRFENGEYIFMLVWGMASVGRAIGGALHYKVRLPKRRKFAIALTVYITINVLEGAYLYTTIPIMMAMCFTTGIMGVTSYNIRIAATQRYVPDEKKGRFNGAFGTIDTMGMVAGQLIAGALAEFLPIRGILSGIMGLGVLAAILIIGGNRSHVARIYNTED